MQATTRLLQNKYKLSRAQAVLFHKDHGSDFESKDEIKEAVGKTHTKWAKLRSERQSRIDALIAAAKKKKKLYK